MAEKKGRICFLKHLPPPPPRWLRALLALSWLLINFVLYHRWNVHHGRPGFMDASKIPEATILPSVSFEFRQKFYFKKKNHLLVLQSGEIQSGPDRLSIEKLSRMYRISRNFVWFLINLNFHLIACKLGHLYFDKKSMDPVYFTRYHKLSFMKQNFMKAINFAFDFYDSKK